MYPGSQNNLPENNKDQYNFQRFNTAPQSNPVKPPVFGNDPDGKIPDIQNVYVNQQPNPYNPTNVQSTYLAPTIPNNLQNQYTNNNPAPTYPNNLQNHCNNNQVETDWKSFAEKVFVENDFDGNGVQDIEEFPILVEKVFKKYGGVQPGYAECKFLMEAFDANGDGEIDKNEYMEMIKAQIE